MRIKILNSSVCEQCNLHSCSFMNMAMTRTDFYKLPSETTICPTAVISEEGPEEKELEDGYINMKNNCIQCGLCVIKCASQNLVVEDFDSVTSDFANLTNEQLNAVTSVYLSSLFDFAANTNRNRSLPFDGYLTAQGEDAFVEVDWNDDSLESLRRILGAILTCYQGLKITNGLIVLSHIPAEGSRDVYEVIKKLRTFPTTKNIHIYLTTFSILKTLCLYLPEGTYGLTDLFYDCVGESKKEYITRVNSYLRKGIEISV